MKTIRIGLLWHSINSVNLGVGALTYSQIQILQDAAKSADVRLKFSVIGWTNTSGRIDDPRIDKVCQVNARQLLGRSPELLATLKECDLILDIGEGDSFSDIYGWKRLTYLLTTKYLASRNKRPLVLSPQTLGPFRNRFAAWLADRAMERARAVCSRDAMSTAYFKSRHLKVEFHEAIDVAFALPFPPTSPPTDRTRVGINVSGLLWSGGYSGKNQFGLKLDYRATLLELVDYFQGLGGVEVVLVPHVIATNRETEDDCRAAQALAAQRDGLTVAGPFASPMDAKSYISSCHFFMGGRMHACIAAFSAGVPCVPMAYSRKFTGLFNTLEYPHVADCTQDDQAKVVSKIKTAFDNRVALTDATAKGKLIARTRLDTYTQLLSKIIREAAHD